MSTLRVDRINFNNDGNTYFAVSNSWNISFVTGDVERLKIDNAGSINISSLISNTITATTVSDSLGNLRDVPFNEQTSAYILQSSDQGKVVSIVSGGVTVPNAVFSQGDNITIYNSSFSSQNITPASTVTMYLVGTANTAVRTLAQRGMATVVCVAANTFVITGGGLT